MPRIDVSLYVIIDHDVEQLLPVEEFTRQVIEGGATCLQVRSKQGSARSVLELARRVLKGASDSGVPVIVNDRLDLALAARAQGVHLGEDDLPVVEARRIAGSSLLIGASASSLAAALKAAADGADYLGVGAVFPTPTKPEAVTIAPGLIAEIRRRISLPIVAIGGINESNLKIPLGQGADGIAIISALRQCPSPGEVTARLKQAIAEAKTR